MLRFLFNFTLKTTSALWLNLLFETFFYLIVLSYQAEICDSPLSILIPDSQWSASSTINHTLFGAYHGRMNNSPETVGWCSSTAKEEKAFIEVRAEFFLSVFLRGFFTKKKIECARLTEMLPRFPVLAVVQWLDESLKKVYAFMQFCKVSSSRRK